MEVLISLELPSLETKSHDIQFPLVHPESSIATCSFSVPSCGYIEMAQSKLQHWICESDGNRACSITMYFGAEPIWPFGTIFALGLFAERFISYALELATNSSIIR